MTLIWVAVLIVAVIIDICTSSALFIWYGIGAIVAIILNNFNFGVTTQVVAFAVVGTILTLIFYPIFKKKVKELPKTTPQEEKYIGQEFIADHDIDENSQVKINGTYWAVTNEGEKIKKGQRYKIIRIEGIKLIIKGR